MYKTSMKNEYRFRGAVVLISVLFISILLFLLLRMVYPAHVEQMKQRARETVSHLHIVIPHIKPDVRQHYLETIQRKNDELSYLLIMDINQLRYLGDDVIAAESGTRAVEIMQSHIYSFSLAIIDLVMPGMSGLETFIELKKIDPGLKVLFTSGLLKKDKIDSYVLDGLAGFIQKPYQLSRLSIMVSEAMKGHYIK